MSSIETVTKESNEDVKLTSSSTTTASTTSATSGAALSALLDLSGKVIVKAQLKDDIRRVPLQNEDITFDELVLMVQRVFKGQLKPEDDIIIKYKDEDGDMITIHDSSDLSFAIACFRVLKLKIIMKNPELSENKCNHNWDLTTIRKEVVGLRDRANYLLDFLDSKSFLLKSTTESQSQTTFTGTGGSADKGKTSPGQKANEEHSNESSSAQQNRRANAYHLETKEFDPLQNVARPDSFTHLTKQAQAQLQQNEIFGDVNVNKMAEHDSGRKDVTNVPPTLNQGVPPSSHLHHMQQPQPQPHQPPPPPRTQGPPQPGPMVQPPLPSQMQQQQQPAPQMPNPTQMSMFPPGGQQYNPVSSAPAYSGYNNTSYASSQNTLGGPAVSTPAMSMYPGSYSRGALGVNSVQTLPAAAPQGYPSGPSAYGGVGSMSVNVNNQPMQMQMAQGGQAGPPPSSQDPGAYGSAMSGGPPPPPGADYNQRYRMTTPPVGPPSAGGQVSNPYTRSPTVSNYK